MAWVLDIDLLAHDVECFKNGRSNTRAAVDAGVTAKDLWEVSSKVHPNVDVLVRLCVWMDRNVNFYMKEGQAPPQLLGVNREKAAYYILTDPHFSKAQSMAAVKALDKIYEKAKPKVKGLKKGGTFC